ncbi:uncharacterized protein At4g17910 isoform X1 [Mercurialis annua]|uniref:uncharacterized protein At4g17910 isoform X1 n=1 Tax=Mercurialis annua TaxID=3986 RepID=UPI00215F7F31|nr:uncharacterized protein At4g17910 isoform X1 [Mercurialis annua]
MESSLNPKKRLKEEFVSNLKGSSMLEIAALSSLIPLLFVFQHSISSFYTNGCNVRIKKHHGSSYMAILTLDFLFLLLPTLFFLTVLAEWIFISAILLAALIFTIAAKRVATSTCYSQGSLSLSSIISSYRVLVMAVTCLCILAVDFRIYPRRYAKTETYGTSLMDCGVGSFILANSLVSRQARSLSFVSLKASIQSTSPLLLLGFGRLLSTNTVDYQVHVGEYGVHWNFFFTLAAVSILTSIIRVPPQYSGILGLAILIGYQFWLVNGLNVYLLSDERGADILSKNKEGIFSILGYWSMYLLGVQFGYYLFFGNQSSTKMKSIKWARIRVLFFSLLLWLITVILDRHVESVSRRMCNMAYVTLVLAQSFQVLAILMLSDFIAGSRMSLLEEAVNRNLLGTFLLANVLTGLVNMSVDTLFSTTPSALFILLVYAYVLSISAGLLQFYGVRLKFW